MGNKIPLSLAQILIQTILVPDFKKIKLLPSLLYDTSQFMKKNNFKRVFQYEHFDTLTTDEMFSGQRFAILAIFF